MGPLALLRGLFSRPKQLKGGAQAGAVKFKLDPATEKQVRNFRSPILKLSNELANGLLRVRESLNNVLRILQYEQTALHSGDASGGAADGGKWIEDWESISKRYGEALDTMTNRTTANEVLVVDFVGIVADYLLYANRSVVQKEEQINHYSTLLISEETSVKDIHQSLKDIQVKVGSFKQSFPRSDTPSKSTAALFAELDLLENGLKNLLERDLRVSPELASMLNNTTYPGIMTKLMTMLSSKESAQLCNLVEGKPNTSATVKEIDDGGKASTSQTDRKVNVAGCFIDIPNMIFDDIRAVEAAQQSGSTNENRIQFMQKLHITTELYKILSDAAVKCGHLLLRAPRLPPTWDPKSKPSPWPKRN